MRGHLEVMFGEPPIGIDGLRLMQGQYRTNMGSLMAGALLAVSPILVIFFLAQRYFVQGIVITGVKG
jgi:multiple sugar transport system permease protein